MFKVQCNEKDIIHLSIYADFCRPQAMNCRCFIVVLLL